MRIDISGHQMDVTPALRDYAQDKLGKIAKHFEQHLETRVILSVDKLEHKAEATIHTPGKTLYADAQAPDMYAALDETIEKIARRMRKHKTRLMKKHRPHRNESIRHLEERFFTEEVLDHPENSDVEPVPFIVHPENYAVRTMYKEDAVMQLELSDRPFVLYKSARRGCLTIVYRRKDGEYAAMDIKD